mmetsp:Transcript_64669/g.107153  ORF Transcript_64669/g.107153 Transcript_64669/m.107153 type:complete len:82 (-) Transcript_64669:1364-1609(-)
MLLTVQESPSLTSLAVVQKSMAFDVLPCTVQLPRHFDTFLFSRLAIHCFASHSGPPIPPTGRLALGSVSAYCHSFRILGQT